VGLAISAATLQNSLKKAMPPEFAPLALSSYNVPDFDALSASPTQIRDILQAYADASRTVFIMNVPFMALCLVGCLLIKDQGLQRPDEVQGVEPGQQVEEMHVEKNVEGKGKGVTEQVVSDARRSGESAGDVKSRV